MRVKYPEITVKLTGQNGNAFMLIGLVNKALRRADAPIEDIARFTEEATSGDYDNVLQTCMKWVNVK